MKHEPRLNKSFRLKHGRKYNTCSSLCISSKSKYIPNCGQAGSAGCKTRLHCPTEQSPIHTLLSRFPHPTSSPSPTFSSPSPIVVHPCTWFWLYLPIISPLIVPIIFIAYLVITYQHQEPFYYHLLTLLVVFTFTLPYPHLSPSASNYHSPTLSPTPPSLQSPPLPGPLIAPVSLLLPFLYRLSFHSTLNPNAGPRWVAP